MNHIIRKTAGVSFFVLKAAVFIFIAFSVMAFLSEIAVRMRMQLAQPFKGVAVIALGVVSALPSVKVIEGLKQKTLGATDEDEFEDESEDMELVSATDS